MVVWKFYLNEEQREIDRIDFVNLQVKVNFRRNFRYVLFFVFFGGRIFIKDGKFKFKEIGIQRKEIISV